MRIVHEIWAGAYAAGGGEEGSPYQTLTIFTTDPVSGETECVHLEGSLPNLRAALEDGLRVIDCLEQLPTKP